MGHKPTNEFLRRACLVLALCVGMLGHILGQVPVDHLLDRRSIALDPQMHEPFTFRSALLGGPLPPDMTRIPASWSYDALGLFCKFDVQLERRLPLPVFFRLGGDVRQVDAWEGKAGAPNVR